MLTQRVFDQRRFLNFIHHFVVFEDDGGGVLTKKVAGYHPFHAVNVALAEALLAAPAAPEPLFSAG